MTSERPGIVDATDREPGEWDRLAARSPFGHAFQSHAWGELKRALGWLPRRYVIEVGDEPVAVVSFQRRALAPRLPGPLGRLTYLYAPRGPILLRDGPEAARAALTGIGEVAALLHAAVVTIDPSWREDGELPAELAPAGFVAAVRDVQVSRTAMIVPLDPDEAAQHARLGDSTANNINLARRAEIHVEPVDLGDATERGPALEEFHAMLAATGRRQGFLVRDRAYLVNQWTALGEAGLASLWFAIGEGRRRCGTLCLHCGGTLVSYQAASTDDANLGRTRANHLLQWEILRWAAGAGFTAYDMGGVDTAIAPGLPRDPSHPLWNLFMFKRGFGAEGVEYVRAHEHAPNQIFRFGWSLAQRFR